jgi:DNA-binding CsgD family transcriptional regulator/PAS domain-containing protein
MQDQLLSAIETFYDCVGEQFDFDRAIAAMGRATNDTGLGLFEIRPMQNRFTAVASHVIPDDAMKAMASGNWDPQTHSLLQHLPFIRERIPVLRRTFTPDEEYHASPVYRETSEPWGLHSDGTILLERTDDRILVNGFVRLPGQDEVDHEILSRMAILSNHLWRATKLQRRLNRLEQAVIETNNVLDLIDFGLLLYRDDSAPAFANQAARRVFAENDGLGLGRRGLVLEDREAQRQFDRLLKAVCSPEHAIALRSGGIVRASRPSGEKPYSVMAVPMRGRSAADIDDVHTAVFIFDPTVKTTSAVGMFVASYGLTPAEATLAHDLAQGVSLDEFSSKRGISRNTAKTQLHAIFAKTDTSRQPELVSLLLRSIAGINLD